ncbi:hydroxymethylglutaryl-CoA reductase, degradative [Capnocytophaga canimorsus]|uniref:3-hydroxy-3-methylglutaryl coenzyme A reductase n=1 Tax=Capnocytophaga canimorsus TaxID=28188 RepID=A0AAC9Z389_9FLAO|nr:hydroxymethylglutaryl-CoA reductase, degradative [Capnocytophaga canimorsus]ATA93964.1 hydroxymethylglutaryl-CoA reductase, degradative [Capnocytophaga canimorsus]
MTKKSVEGFSKFTKEEKINWLCNTYFPNENDAKSYFEKYHNTDAHLQKLHDEFIENTVSNYYLPFAVAPNFLINGKTYTVPMAIEESSVVAAASRAAKFWESRGGFKATVISTEKNGQVHFMFYGEKARLETFFRHIKPILLEAVKPITANMEKRGGGITNLHLVDKTADLPNYYQLFARFETLDAMGANFINSCLEQFAHTLQEEAEKIPEIGQFLEIIMSILSNYVPECLVKSEVSCPVEQLSFGKIEGKAFAEKFVKAIAIANAEVRRATTHNKGIMNGIDSVVLATGNDFRAVEAGVHAYASRSGKYQSLSHAYIKNGIFYFEIQVPLALGTVGGLTNLHPLVKTALQILEKPSAPELMQIAATVGLAQNFAAVGALTTSGIQKGHMKMHLMNILNQLGATQKQKQIISDYFKDKTISHSEVVKKFEELNAQ